MQECAFALAMPVFRKLLPKEGMAFLDQNCPKSMEELMDTLQQWCAIARSRPSDEVSKPKMVASHPNRFSPVQCFSCGKMGHQAFECRARSSTFSHNALPATRPPATRTDSSMWTCFSCGKKGNKSSACPDRVGGHRSTPTVTPKTAPAYQLTVRPMCPAKGNVVRGMVGNVELDFILNTGASVSMVPQSSVCDKQMTKECVVVENVNRGVVRRPLAKVDITLKGLKGVSEVVVAPDVVLKGKVLFAICLNNAVHRKILCSWDEPLETLPVKAVITRAEVAAEAVVKAEEAALIAVEQPRCTPVVGKSSEPRQVECERLEPSVSSVESKTVEDSNNWGGGSKGGKCSRGCGQ